MLTILFFLLAACNMDNETTPAPAPVAEATTPAPAPVLTCTFPDGVTPTPFDKEGRLLVGTGTFQGDLDVLIVCDKSGGVPVPRAIAVYGMTPGAVEDAQAPFMTDGSGHIITQSRVVTTATSPTVPDGLSVPVKCLEDFRQVGLTCDPAPASEPDLGESDATAGPAPAQTQLPPGLTMRQPVFPAPATFTESPPLHHPVDATKKN